MTIPGFLDDERPPSQNGHYVALSRPSANRGGRGDVVGLLRADGHSVRDGWRSVICSDHACICSGDSDCNIMFSGPTAAAASRDAGHVMTATCSACAPQGAELGFRRAAAGAA